MIEARVIKLISNKWTVKVGNKTYDCTCAGKIKFKKESPVVGDNVLINEESKVIEKILPRKNNLVRPPVSNIDIALVLTSCIEPSFSSNLLDKLLAIIEFNNIKPVICFTKYDLLGDTKEIDDIIKYYKKIGYDVVINSEEDKIKSIIKNKICVLTGQTGVGKSSLLNRLKKGLNLKTGEISKVLGRGRHTTRHVELLNIEDSYIADTPGFSSLDFIGMDEKSLKDNFIEFYKHEDKCKYKDCYHLKEDGCYIKEMVKCGDILYSRYDNYVKFNEEIKKEKKW